MSTVCEDGRSGTPRTIVSIACAWISGPAISSLPVDEVAWTSCRDGAEAPTTTIRPRTALGGNLLL